ncbi:MAG TPA: hypothetical protein VKU00_16975 [Chthonomonadaceae bacterium]|nr:hypothetical protein [Chthonomonadaceae bacterium]
MKGSDILSGQPFKDDSIDVGREFPEWQPVGQPKPVPNGNSLVIGRSYVELEGIIADNDVLKPVDGTAHVSFEDFPISHYTHDFCFKVNPDPAFKFLLALQHHPDTFTQEDPETNPNNRPIHQNPPVRHKNPDTIQAQIEVEWENGLAAGNDGNPASAPNRLGNSFGFFSTGHTSGAQLWNWPTARDWVHVDGLWIFDRSHPPADTEIHPPRLVAVRRHLPEVFHPADEPGSFFFSTRADIFASGDSNVYWNNRSGQPFFVQKVPMSEKDYTFNIDQTLPRPLPSSTSPGQPNARVRLPGSKTPRAQGPAGNVPQNEVNLKFEIDKEPGDTFPVDPIVQPFPDGEPGHPVPHVRVTIPWRSAQAPDTAVFARTIHLFWDNTQAHGVADTFQARAYQFTLDKFQVINPQHGLNITSPSNQINNPSSFLNPGPLRVFVEVGGNWFFLNDIIQSNPLDGGLSDAHAGQVFPINHTFLVICPKFDTFRVHAGGWAPAGIDSVMGHVINQYDQNRSRVQSECNATFLSTGVLTSGGRDRPIGEVNTNYSGGSGVDAIGVVERHSDFPVGEVQTDEVGNRTDPNKDFKLFYHLQEVTFTQAGSMAKRSRAVPHKPSSRP